MTFNIKLPGGEVDYPFSIKNEDLISFLLKMDNQELFDIIGVVLAHLNNKTKGNDIIKIKLKELLRNLNYEKIHSNK